MPRVDRIAFLLPALFFSGLLGLHKSANVEAAAAPVAIRGAESPKGVSSQDWTSIRAAYDAGRHAISVDDDGALVARNPGQQWLTRFDGRGFTVTPDAGGWTWGLELRGFGFAGAQAVVGGNTASASVSHEQGRVFYDWSPALREWFVNDARGVEQGWTINERPAQNPRGGPLRLDFNVRGGLVPEFSADEHSVAFHTATGASALNFAGLKAWDADGRALAVRFEAAGKGGLRIAVNENDARYPITIDPIAQQAYLKASNTESFDNFGFSVAISGDTVVVGAIQEDSGASGVNGDQTDNSLLTSGAAYVFVRSGTTWSQQAYLKASNPVNGPQFGTSVGISGDTIAVSAAAEGTGASNSGAVYVFVRNGTTWSQQALLKASNLGPGDTFGNAVAVSGDTVVVGAEFEDSNAIGIDGNQADNSAADSGAAYVFVRNGSTWTQQAYLKASNTGAGDRFGISVTTSGETIVVGAPLEDSNATGVDGNQADESVTSAGAAYVFVRNGTSWTQQAYLKSSNARPKAFGSSVAASDDLVVVGAPGDPSNAVGVDGIQTDTSAPNSGAAYVFVRNGSVWAQQAYLKASNTATNDRFGKAVAASVDAVLIGAPSEQSNATGVDGNQADNSLLDAGAAYLFVRDGTNWSQHAYLKASNTQVSAFFGEALAASSGSLVVGAPIEDGNAVGVNGTSTDNSVFNSGAAYVFIGVPVPQTSLVVKNADRFGEPSAGLAGVTVTLFGARSPSPTAVTDSQGLVIFPSPAIDPSQLLDIRLERDLDRRTYKDVRLNDLATTPLVLPRGLRSLLLTQLNFLQATSTLVLPYETAPARALMDEWNTLQAQLPSVHVDRDRALARLLIASGGLVDVYNHTEPLAQDAAKVTVDVVTSVLALRKLLAELQSAAASQGADLLAEGFTAELARQVNTALSFLLKIVDVGVGELQSSLIDAVRSVLPGWAADLLDGAIGATTKGVLDGFGSGAWSNQDARKGVLESVVSTIAPKVGGSLLATAYVAQTQTDLSLATTRARNLAGTGTVVDAFTASQNYANFVTLRNDEVLSFSTLVAGVAKGWSTAADFFLIVGKVPVAQIATGAGTIVKAMSVGGLVVVAVNDYTTLFDTAFDDAPVVAGRAFDPGQAPTPAAVSSGLKALLGGATVNVVPMSFVTRLAAFKDRINANDRAGAINQAELLLAEIDGLDAAVRTKMLQLLALTAGSNRTSLEAAHRATLAKAGVLAGEQMRLYASIAGFIIPQFAETGADNESLIARIDLVAQAIMEFETAASNADAEAVGLVAPALVVVGEHGLGDVFGQTPPGPIVLRARVVNAGQQAADGVTVEIIIDPPDGPVPVVTLTSPASQLVGTLAPGESRLVTWNANATDTTASGTGSTATYAIDVSATSGRSSDAAGGLEVRAKLIDQVFGNGFEQ